MAPVAERRFGRTAEGQIIGIGRRDSEFATARNRFQIGVDIATADL